MWLDLGTCKSDRCDFRNEVTKDRGFCVAVFSPWPPLFTALRTPAAPLAGGVQGARNRAASKQQPEELKPAHTPERTRIRVPPHLSLERTVALAATVSSALWETFQPEAQGQPGLDSREIHKN